MTSVVRVILFFGGGYLKQSSKCRSWSGAAVATALALLLTGVPTVRAQSASSTEDPTPEAPTVQTLIPIGQTVGIKLFSDGVLVVGMAGVETADGTCQPGKDCGLKTGDRITHINGQDVDTIEAVQTFLAEGNGAPLTIQAQRGNKSVQLSATPAASVDGDYRLGVWLRDSMAGIGTVTFYDPASGRFGALGHGISDTDTSMLVPLQSGSILPATIENVQRGVTGTPGELHGTFDLTRDLGPLYANTEQGIFGTAPARSLPTEQMALPVAKHSEIKVGPATILSNVQGSKVEEFDIQILRVCSCAGQSNRALTIQVTDPRLLEQTGGIVQGMSGSPILQNGKLIGAVTHVLVNDPTRGYGIRIEDMLKSA